MMNDPRIGTRTADSVVWPERDCYGAAYNRPASTVALSDTHFCVVPVNFIDNGILGILKSLLKVGKKTE